MSATRQPRITHGRHCTYWKRETTANGFDLELWGFDQEQDLLARRFAAELPRETQYVNEICTGIGNCVDVWLNPPDEPMHRFEPPEGWLIEKVDHFDGGNVCMTLVREEAV